MLFDVRLVFVQGRIGCFRDEMPANEAPSLRSEPTTHLLLELEPDELQMNSRVTPRMGREGEVGRGTRLLGTGEDMRDAAERLVDVVLAAASRVRLRKPALTLPKKRAERGGLNSWLR